VLLDSRLFVILPVERQGYSHHIGDGAYLVVDKVRSIFYRLIGSYTANELWLVRKRLGARCLEHLGSMMNPLVRGLC